MEKMIHKRYIAGTTAFIDFIKELGYELSETNGHNLQKKEIYKTKDQPTKYIETSFEGLKLYVLIKGKPYIHYQGVSVHDELVKFFTKRDIKI